MGLVAVMILGLFFNRFFTEVAETAFKRPMAELGRGGVAFIVIPVASIILLVTVIGAPLGVLGLIAYTLLLIVAHVAAAMLVGALVGSWIFKKGYEVSWRTILIGFVMYYILGFVPLIGWLVKAVFCLMALGAVVRIKTEVLNKWR